MHSSAELSHQQKLDMPKQKKEMLAVAFAVRKFHPYTFGRNARIITDLKLLESIMRELLYKVPRRLQSMLKYVQTHDIDIEYRPGKSLLLADTMSRAYLPDTGQGEKYLQIHVANRHRIQKVTLEKVTAATNSDPALCKLEGIIHDGMNDVKAGVPLGITPFFAIRDELTVDDIRIYKYQ